jgi:hypothetical protein
LSYIGTAFGGKPSVAAAEEYYEMNAAQGSLDFLVGIKLFNEARALDVETAPISEEDMWVNEDDGPITQVHNDDLGQ